MPRNRPLHLFYALAVAVALILIGRNLYYRTLNNALVAAVRNRDVSAVRRLLTQGADPNYRFTDTMPNEIPTLPQPVLSLAFSRLEEDAAATYAGVAPIPNGTIHPDLNAKAEQIVLLLLRHGAHWQGIHALELACRLGDVAVADELLRLGDDLRSSDNTYTPEAALDYATTFRVAFSNTGPISMAHTPKEKAEVARRQVVSRQLVHLLQEHGLRLTLLQAQRIGDTATVKKLLDGSMPGNIKNGYFAMVRAAASGDLDTIRQLLKQGVDPNRHPQLELSEWPIPGLVDDTPLHIAAGKGQIEVVKLLLTHGADPNQITPFGSMPLEVAAGADNLALVQLLLARGARPNPIRPQGYPALAYAAGTGDIKLVQLLLAHGAKLDASGSSFALVAAIMSKHPAVVRYLLERGAGTAAEPPTSLPLLTIALHSMPDVVPDLLKHGAPVNPPPIPVWSGRSGSTVQANNSYAEPNSPLMAAVWYAPQYEATLVRAGAKIGLDRSIICAVAAQQKRLDLLPKLLAYGADINGTDSAYDPALSICVRSVPMAKTLLEHGADPNVLSHKLRTPLQEAAMTGNTEVVRLLLAHGAKVNQHVVPDHTALYWARKKNHPDITALLQQAGAQE
jgi:uncharacterized protein